MGTRDHLLNQPMIAFARIQYRRVAQDYSDDECTSGLHARTLIKQQRHRPCEQPATTNNVTDSPLCTTIRKDRTFPASGVQ